MNARQDMERVGAFRVDISRCAIDGHCVRTCVSLLCVMLSDSNVKRKYCKLLSLSILSCVLENCNCRMNTPGTNMSDESEVADRSKSYSDSVCTGDFIS